jgi:hypothetical protein
MPGVSLQTLKSALESEDGIQALVPLPLSGYCILRQGASFRALAGGSSIAVVTVIAAVQGETERAILETFMHRVAALNVCWFSEKHSWLSRRLF